MGSLSQVATVQNRISIAIIPVLWSDTHCVRRTISSSLADNHQMRFRLLHLMSIVAAVAVYLGISQSAGYWVTAAIFFAITLTAWSLLSERRRAFIYLRIAVGTVSLAAIWFLAVDWSCFVEQCPDCLSDRYIDQYRILGYPVHTRVDEASTIVDKVLADLGAPCYHDKMDRWQMQRWWGLHCCGWPCWNGTLSLSGDDDDLYTQELSARLRERGRMNPAYASELRRRVVELHDYDYFWDAFMVDELALQWADAASTCDALSWLKDQSSTSIRTVNERLTTDESIEMIEAAYEAGATSVLAIEIQCDRNSPKEQVGALLVRLPSDTIIRKDVLAWVDQHDSDRAIARKDYGQSYVRFFP